MLSRSSSRLAHRANLLLPTQQVRHATLIRRPKRPYTFTQLITLSDGSTFTHRTTSPEPIYRSIKDTKNNALWNPTSQKLLNVEEDEAGRLRRFRQRFGRGFDAEAATGDEDGSSEGASSDEGSDDHLMDLIGGYGQLKGTSGSADDSAVSATTSAGSQASQTKSGKGSGGKK